MKTVLALALLLAPLASSAGEPFPLPAVDGKPLAVAAGQKLFRLPLRFSAVERFYRERWEREAGVRVRPELVAGKRALVIESRRPGDVWAKATVREGELETLVELVPVFRAEETAVEGKAIPLAIIIPRSSEAAKMADQIEHLEHKAP
jgi:hypothetical protein